MGEYIKHSKLGEVKIGTCESLYYVTLKEFKAALPEMGTEADIYLQPNEFRFRFPFPDEDGRKFGDDGKGFDRGYLLSVPKAIGIEIGHADYFFRVGEGKLPNHLHMGVNMPCPVTLKNGNGIKIYDWHNTSDYTIFEVVSQKICNDENTGGTLEVWTCVRCPYCGHMVRLSSTEAFTLQRWAETLDKEKSKEIIEVIARIVDGYTIETLQDIN